jgi:hypothetical protein
MSASLKEEAVATIDEVHAALEQAVGETLDPKIWSVLVEWKRHSAARKEKPGIHSFESAIESMAGDYRQLAGLSVRPENLRRSETREIPGDTRTQALAEILALDAGRLPAVAEFRRKYLPDGLLGDEHVGSWVRTRACKLTPSPDGYLQFLAGDEYHRDMGNYAGELDEIYDPEPHAQQVQVSRDSELWELRDLSRGLALRSGWSRATATNLVLTGASPAPVKAVAWIRRRSPFEALTRIVIEVDPRLPSSEVRRLYGELRRELRGGGDQKMSPKHIELALFIARDGSRLPRSIGLEIESLSYHGRDRRSRLILGRIAPDTHGQGTPWPELQKRWNRLHPEWAYDDVRARRFSRDVRNAWKRVTGQSWWSPLTVEEAEGEDSSRGGRGALSLPPCHRRGLRWHGGNISGTSETPSPSPSGSAVAYARPQHQSASE